MKIYKITESVTASTNYCYPGVMEESLWSEQKLFISECTETYELPIPYNVDNKIPPNDFPVCHNILVSKNFLEVIKKFNADFNAYESQMHYNGKNKMAFMQEHNDCDEIWDIYYTMQFPSYSLLNWDKSDFLKYYNDEINKTIVTRINKLIIDKNKIEVLNFKNNIFHLEEKKTFLLCTETAKQAIEEAGLTGIDFEEVPVE